MIKTQVCVHQSVFSLFGENRLAFFLSMSAGVVRKMLLVLNECLCKRSSVFFAHRSARNSRFSVRLSSRESCANIGTHIRSSFSI